MGFAAKRKRMCAINEKKAAGYNLQIIWQERRERDVARSVPSSWEAFLRGPANGASGEERAGLSAGAAPPHPFSGKTPPPEARGHRGPRREPWNWLPHHPSPAPFPRDWKGARSTSQMSHKLNTPLGVRGNTQGPPAGSRWGPSQPPGHPRAQPRARRPPARPRGARSEGSSSPQARRRAGASDGAQRVSRAG